MSSRAAARRVDSRSPARDRLTLVQREKKSPKRRLPWLVIISLICVFSVIFAVLIARVVLVKTSFKLQKLQNELTAAEELHEELLLEAAKKESPARIERVARSMGMVDPPTVNYIVADIAQPTQEGFASGGDLGPSTSTSSTVAALGEETP